MSAERPQFEERLTQLRDGRLAYETTVRAARTTLQQIGGMSGRKRPAPPIGATHGRDDRYRRRQASRAELADARAQLATLAGQRDPHHHSIRRARWPDYEIQLRVLMPPVLALLSLVATLIAAVHGAWVVAVAVGYVFVYLVAVQTVFIYRESQRANIGFGAMLTTYRYFALGRHRRGRRGDRGAEYPPLLRRYL